MLPIDAGQLKAPIIDVDGTLYRQGPVRRAMLWRLLRAHLEQLARGVSPLGIIHYAARLATSGADINYIVQPLSKPPLVDLTQVGEDRAAAVYVKDVSRWERDRFRFRRTNFRSPIYDIPRETLFRHWGERSKNYTIDLRFYPVIWRLFSG